METMITVIAYIFALLGVVFLFLYFRLKSEYYKLNNEFRLTETKYETIKHFVDKGYDIKFLQNFIKY